MDRNELLDELKWKKERLETITHRLNTGNLSDADVDAVRNEIDYIREDIASITHTLKNFDRLEIEKLHSQLHKWKKALYHGRCNNFAEADLRINIAWSEKKLERLERRMHGG